jgi:hypothetical protein
MSGIEILPALVYSGLTAAEAAGTAGAVTTAGAGLGAGSLGAALGGLFGGGAAGSAGMTAAEMKALEAAAAQSVAAGGEGFGVSSFGSAQGASGLLGDLGGTEVANMSVAPLNMSMPSALGTGTGSAESSLWGNIATEQLPPAQTEGADLLTKGLNALNKVGGTLNKLPKPVQGMLMSSLLAPPKQQTPPPASMPPRQAQQAPAMQPTYQTSAPPPQYFAGSGGASGVGDGMGGGYGGSAKVQGLLGQAITPEELAMLRRLRMQRGGM